MNSDRRDSFKRNSLTNKRNSTPLKTDTSSEDEMSGRCQVPNTSVCPTEIKLEMDNISRSSSSDSVVSDSECTRNEGTADIITERTFQTVSVEEDDKNVPLRNLPAVNVPEKIVLCVDISEEPDATPFKLGDGTVYTPFSMIKRIVEIFMYGKSSVNKNHEFALVILKGEQVIWITDFTKDPRPVIRELNKCSPVPESNTFDMSALFSVLQENIHLPAQTCSDVPDFVPRVILIYSRSICTPMFVKGREAFKILTECPFITLDVLYVHEDVSNDNKCEDIYNQLMEVDHLGYSYIFHVVRNPKILHDNMAKLLAHPLQRPVQKKASYKFEQISVSNHNNN